MIYASTLSEYQQVMRWKLAIEQFGTKIQHVAEVENIVSDMLSRLPSTSVKNYEPSTFKAQCHANELLSIGREENNEDFPLLNILNVQIEEQKDLRKLNSKLSA